MCVYVCVCRVIYLGGIGLKGVSASASVSVCVNECVSA